MQQLTKDNSQRTIFNLPLVMNRKEVKRKNRETEGLTNSLTKKEV